MKEVLSKEEFIKYINKIKEVDNRLSKLYNILYAWPGGEDKISLLTECSSLLSFIMDDPEDKIFGTYIDWWLWETNFGQDERCNKIWYFKDTNKEIEKIIDTPEKLYDLLIENMEERKSSKN